MKIFGTLGIVLVAATSMNAQIAPLPPSNLSHGWSITMGVRDEWPTKFDFNEFFAERAASDLSKFVPPTPPASSSTATFTAFAHSTLMVQPAPHTSASVFAESVGGILKTVASAAQFADYSLSISGPAPTVPVRASARGAVSASFSGTGDSEDFAYGLANLFVKEVGGAYVYYRLIEAAVQSAGAEADSFAINSTFTLKTDTLYTVSLYTHATTWASLDSSGRASASIDPTFSIDLPSIEAADYQLHFSPGIGNETTLTPVPESSTLLALLSLPVAMLVRLRHRQSRPSRVGRQPSP